ncbi:MAG: 2OG-Fe(II) oxygenase [Bacteriovorax sp.]|nr:2OG-Fe(II) oxygenase [Bacteriovorax sp.]
MILSTELDNSNILEVTYPLPEKIIAELRNQNWQSIDQYFLEAERPGGALFEFLRNYLTFESIEHIIAIRSAPSDEDGIWHDDGSRILGFTISLTEKPELITGGELRFKKKNDKEWQSVSTRKLGQMMLFKTGIYGFEHMVTAVTSSKRIIIAGWCS